MTASPAAGALPDGNRWTRPGDRSWDVLGVGDIDVDLCLRVDRLPGRDEKVLGALLGEYPGGMISNVCCAASRFGARTAMIGSVGDDPYGPVAVDGLTKFGVDTTLVRVVAGGRTFFCVVLLDDSGEKALTVVQTDCRLPRRRDVTAANFARARLVHVMADDAQFAQWAAAEAHAHGALVSVDMEASTTQQGMPALEPLLASVDIAFLNQASYHGFDGDPAGALARVLRLGPRVAVVTLGSRGALVGTTDGARHVPTHPVPVIDSTGAGDCFIGAFLSCILDGMQPTRCAELASAAAALSLSAVGARSALPDRAQAQTFLSQAARAEPRSVPC